MAIITTYGPYRWKTTCTPSQCTSVLTPISAWTRRIDKPVTVRRPRPIGALALLGSPTTRTWTETYQSIGTVYGPYGGHGPSEGVACHGFTSIPGADEALIGTMYSRAKDETINLGVFLGEFRETSSFIGQVARSIWESYRAVRKGRLKDLYRIWFPRRGGYSERATISRSVRDKWLAWRYAVSPMLGDLDGLIKELYGARNNSYISSVSAKASSGITFRDTTRAYAYFESMSAQWRSRAYYSVNVNTQAFMRLGLLNPLSVLYELTPYSFIVDWFIPIGNYIGQLDTAAAITVVGKPTLSVRWTSRVVTSGLSYGGSFATAKGYRRTLFAWTPRLPTVRQGLQGKRIYDAMALLSSRMEGRR